MGATVPSKNQQRHSPKRRKNPLSGIPAIDPPTSRLANLYRHPLP